MFDIGAITFEFWGIVVSSVVVFIGWGVVHFSSKRNDLQNRKKEVVSSYLINAYRSIETCCGREKSIGLTPEQKTGIEQAIAEVQLFGSTSQISLAKKFIESMNASAYGDPRDLLVVLRNELRAELGLPAALSDPNDIVHWRLK